MPRGDNKPAGSAHWNSKLTEDDVRNIRLRAARGDSAAELAREFNTSRQNITMIVKRVRWGKVY